MKKILLTGIIVVLFAVLFVTCDGLFPEETSAEVEYTDVVYSKDGSQVTVYLDGIGVPKAPAQRAMSLGLAEMAYDYLEVIFLSGTTRARSQWELGESAGINGVARSVAYGSTSLTGPTALMAVGTKDGKTLLGVGRLLIADAQPPATWPTGDVTIGPNTKYVVFGLTAVKTGLQAAGKPTPLPANTVNSITDFPASVKESLSTLGGVEYPMFTLPAAAAADATITAKYTFGGAADTYKGVLIFDTAAEVAKKRIPRYMESGRYLIPKGRIDTKTTVKGVATANVVDLTFTTQPNTSGIFSFYIDIPVNLLLKYNSVASPDLDTNAGTNGGYLQSVNWHLRTGFGSDLYSLDDGLSSGGCVLMGMNVGPLDWLEIQWVWEKPTT